MPQLTNGRSRQQSIMGPARELRDHEVTGRPVPSLPATTLQTRAPVVVANVDNEETDFLGPIEEGIPAPASSRASKFERLRRLEIGQSCFVKRASVNMILNMLRKSTGNEYVWSRETRAGVKGCRVWRVEPKKR